MKLHHFISAKVSEDSSRVRELGKALLPAATPTPVTEVKLTDIKKLGTKKIEEPKDQTEAMRDYAVDQLASSTCHSAHHKIKHYD